MYTENDHKYVVVINRNIEAWKAFNVVAHLSNALQRSMRARSDLQFASYDSQDGKHYGDFPIHPYVILEAKSAEKLRNIWQRAGESHLDAVAIIDPMIGRSTEEQVKAAKEIPTAVAEFIGIAFYGEAGQVDSITKSLSVLTIPGTLTNLSSLAKASFQKASLKMGSAQ